MLKTYRRASRRKDAPSGPRNGEPRSRLKPTGSNGSKGDTTPRRPCGCRLRRPTPASSSPQRWRLSASFSSRGIATRRLASRFSIWRQRPCAEWPVRSARRRALDRAHACDRSAQYPPRPWDDRLRHGKRTPGLEPSAEIRFAALHNGLERGAAGIS